MAMVIYQRDALQQRRSGHFNTSDASARASCRAVWPQRSCVSTRTGSRQPFNKCHRTMGTCEDANSGYLASVPCCRLALAAGRRGRGRSARQNFWCSDPYLPADLLTCPGSCLGLRIRLPLVLSCFPQFSALTAPRRPSTTHPRPAACEPSAAAAPIPNPCKGRNHRDQHAQTGPDDRARQDRFLERPMDTSDIDPRPAKSTAARAV